MTNSILDEKCECGRDVDYFKLTGKYNNEIKRKNIRSLMLSYMIICFVIIVSFFGIFIKTDISDINIGIFIGFSIGVVYMEFFNVLEKKSKLKKYNESEERKKHIKELKYQNDMKNKNYTSIYISIFVIIILVVGSIIYTIHTIFTFILIDILKIPEHTYIFLCFYFFLAAIFLILLKFISKQLIKIKKGKVN